MTKASTSLKSRSLMMNLRFLRKQMRHELGWKKCRHHWIWMFLGCQAWLLHKNTISQLYLLVFVKLDHQTGFPASEWTQLDQDWTQPPGQTEAGLMTGNAGLRRSSCFSPELIPASISVQFLVQTCRLEAAQLGSVIQLHQNQSIFVFIISQAQSP